MITVKCPNCDCTIHVDETNKRGKWIPCKLSKNIEGLECSECHEIWGHRFYYCPSCGTKNREESR